MITVVALAGLLSASASPVLDDEPAYKGRPVSEWILQLKSSRLEQRAAAVKEFGPDAIVCVPALIESLQTESLDWHENSCNPEPRRHLAAAFVRIGPEAVPALRRALSDRDGSVRGWSAFILASMRHEPRQTAEELLPLLNDPDAGVRQMAIRALNGLGPQSWMATGAVIETLKDADPNVRATAIGALRCVPGDLLATFATSLEDSNPKVRQTAVLFLRRFGKAAVPHLIKSLSDSDARVRRDAAYELKSLGPVANDAVSTLVKLLNSDSDRDVRYAVADALGATGPTAEGAVHVLAAAVQGDDYVCSAAVRSLGQIGPAAKAAVPALRERLRVEEQQNRPIRGYLRKEIRAALQLIEPPAVAKSNE
jgi:HEAT repeat protein